MNCQETIDVMGDEVEGTLEPTFRAGFEEHITECPSCGTYLEQLRLTRKALALLPRDGITSPRRDELIERFTRGFDHKND